MKNKIEVYGIKNCSSVKKVLDFLESKKLQYDFVDYKKQAPSKNLLQDFCENLDWQKVLNQKSQTWRNLDAEQKLNLDKAKAIEIMQSNPSIIKRPLLKIETDKKTEYLLGVESVLDFFK